MATFDTKYFTEKQREHRKKEKEMLVRYHSWEPYPGETFKEFSKRVTGKTIKITNESDKIYRGWEMMPHETKKEFRRRFSSKKAK